jgi:hypothetical protein
MNNNDDPIEKSISARAHDTIKSSPPPSRLRAIPSNILPDMNATVPLMIPPLGFLRQQLCSIYRTHPRSITVRLHQVKL